MSTKNILFETVSTALITTLFIIGIIKGSVIFCILMWITGGAFAFEINVGIHFLLFRKQKKRHIGTFCLFVIFGLIGLLYSTYVYFDCYLSEIKK